MTATAVRPAHVADDRIVVDYHSALTHSRGQQLLASAGSELASAELLRDIAARADAATDLLDGISSTRILAALARNTNLDTAHIAHLFTHPNRSVSASAAANASLGPERVAELWALTGDLALLANPHLDRCVIAERWEDDPNAATQNPNIDVDILRCCSSVDHQAHLTAMSHPNMAPDIIAARLTDATSLPAWAHRHPAVTADQLHELRTRCAVVQDPPRLPAVRDRQLDEIDRAIDWRHYSSHPDDMPVHNLMFRFAPAPIAAVLRVGGDHADALISLIRAGFDGTVGELVDVAASVTASQHGTLAAGS